MPEHLRPETSDTVADERSQLVSFAGSLAELMRADRIDLEHENTRTVVLALYVVSRADDASARAKQSASALLRKLDPRGKLKYRYPTLEACTCAQGFVSSIERMIQLDNEDLKKWRTPRT